MSASRRPGKIVYGDAAVEHHKEKQEDSGRNLRIYQSLLDKGEPLDVRVSFYYARELMTHEKYEQAVQAFETFLAMPEGWVENRIEACRNLADCLTGAGRRRRRSRRSCARLRWISRRGETCCALAALELEEGRLPQAEFWYRTALRVPCRAESGGFVYKPSYGYIPCLGLCVCCDRQGQA